MGASDRESTNGRGRAAAMLLLGLLLVGAVAGAWLWGETEALLPLRVLRIQGNVVHTPEADLREAVAPFAAVGFARLDLAGARQALEALPWVAAAEVRRGWPDALVVSIREQVAVGRWAAGGLLNEAAERFFPPVESMPEGLPLLQGPEGSEAMVLQTYRSLAPLVAPLGTSIARVTVDERLSWRLMLAEGIEVIIGREEIAPRLSRFVRAYRRVLAQRAAEIGRVDLRYTNGFAVRWKAPRESVG